MKRQGVIALTQPVVFNVLHAVATSKLRIKPYTLLGVTLLGLFFLQYGYGIKFHWLAHWQHVTLYKQLTGFMLVGYLLLQWQLGMRKMRNKTSRLTRVHHLHKWQGALAPMIYYIHSMELGYAYQLLLSGVYFGNVVVGLFNPEMLNRLPRGYRTGWLIAHIGLAVLTLALVLYHVYVTYWYS